MKKATKKRFTFADAKAKIAELEDKLSAVEFNDNVFTNEEVKKLKNRKYVGGFFGFIAGVIFISLATIQPSITVTKTVDGMDMPMTKEMKMDAMDTMKMDMEDKGIKVDMDMDAMDMMMKDDMMDDSMTSSDSME